MSPRLALSDAAAVMSNPVYRVIWLQPNVTNHWSNDEIVAGWLNACPVKARQRQDAEKVSPVHCGVA